MDGYIKIHRKILGSQVFAHQTALKIWIWILAKAGYSERFVPFKINRGETTVKLIPGQFIFGRFTAEEELGIDGSTIYKWLQKFSSPDFNMIKLQSNNHYTIISVCNWQIYQNGEDNKVTTIEQPSNNQVTAEEQPSNSHVTQTKRVKKVKKYIPFDEFYKSELANNEDKNYHIFVEWLLGKNENNRPFEKCLSLKDQIGYKQFIHLRGIAQENGTKLMSKIIDLENKFSTYKAESLNLTLCNWLKRKFK